VEARDAADRLVGIVTRSDLLKARLWMLTEEERRERVLTLAPLMNWRGWRSERGTVARVSPPIESENVADAEAAWPL
jgi:CBS-domain-containing membrane protein